MLVHESDVSGIINPNSYEENTWVFVIYDFEEDYHKSNT